MSCKASKRVGFSPDGDGDDNPMMSLKNGDRTRIAGIGRDKKVADILGFRPLRGSVYSPARFLRRIGAKVARVMNYMTGRRKGSRKVSSAGLTRSRSLADVIDSQRAEAIEDCIQFLNSSSSLPRSNSVSSTWSC